MKKTIILLLFMLLAATAIGADVFMGDEQPEYLFVVSAPSGSFDGDVLTLEGVSAVVYFSDRPERIAGHMVVSDFILLWDEGEDSFMVDPPNATLSIIDDGTMGGDVVVELTDADSVGDTLAFHIDVLDGVVPGAFGTASLFLDAAPTEVNSMITD